MPVEEAVVAGRELDIAVAEIVLQFHAEVAPKDAHGNHGGTKVLVPPGNTLSEFESVLPKVGPIPAGIFVLNYSTDIEYAWRVVERMRSRSWFMEFDNQDGPYVTFWKKYHRDERIGRRGKTVPEAICRAAIAALSGPSGKRTTP